MNITFRCKCGRTTTYGLKCVTCSGSTFDFIKRSTIEEEEFGLEEQPYEAYENTTRHSNKRTSSSRPAIASVILNNMFYASLG